MKITDEQIKFLSSFSCERLTSNPDNKALINSFQSRRGNGLVQYMINRGWDLDEKNENAFYLIKDPNGTPCMFFALKCGALYTPLDEDKIQHQIDDAQQLLVLLKETEAGDAQRDNLYLEIERFRQERNMSLDAVVQLLSQNAITEKNKHMATLERLKKDREREGTRPIQRVEATFPGVELTHLCVDDSAKEAWKRCGFRFPIGEVMFWWFIAPIFIELQKLVGCQFAFLFAADASPDGTLTNYYSVALKFSKYQNVGTSKPYYDWCCEFMSQEVNQLRENRKFFFENFNIDEGVDLV